MSKDSTLNILVVAVTLCLVCSVIVSTAAVTLRPAQQHNKILDQKINILKVAGLWRENADIDRLFAAIEPRIVDMDQGVFAAHIDAGSYDQRRAAKNPDVSIALDDSVDRANINRRANFAKIYLVKQNQQIARYVFPVHGYGLWSTLYGYVALEKDMNTVYALKFYEHRETPGLGGEVDNPQWQAGWRGKRLFNQHNQLALSVIKGSVAPAGENAIYQVDGLSGATLTANGVTDMLHFWMGEYGFGKFIDNMRAGEM